MASNNDQNNLNLKFENWMTDKLKAENNYQDSDVSIFINFILSALTEDDTSDEEKIETIKPILQELNQNNTFNEEKLLKEIIEYWKKIKIDCDDNNSEKMKNKNNAENPTDTILNMINKHKNQLVEPKKKIIQEDEDEGHAGYSYNEEESDSEKEESAKKDNNLFANTNLQDALSRDKQNRDKMAEAYQKQRDQAKKALIDQKQKEIDKKKKAQQKAAKVERKR